MVKIINESINESKSIKEDRESAILNIKSNIEDNLVLDNYMGKGKSNYNDYQIELFHDSDNYGGYPWYYKISKDGNIVTKKYYGGDDLSNALYSVAQFIYNVESKSIKESSTTKYGEVRNEFSDLIKLYNDRKIKYLVPTNAYRFSTRYEIYDKNDYYIGVYEDVNDEHSEFFDDAFTEEMYGEWFRLYPTYRKKYYDDQFNESKSINESLKAGKSLKESNR